MKPFSRVVLAISLIHAIPPTISVAQTIEDPIPTLEGESDNAFGLTPNEASSLLQKLLTVRDGFSGSKEQVLQSALTRFSTAAQSESAAAEFYLAAWKVVNIDRKPVAEGDQPPGDDWQKKLIDRMKQTGTPRALRVQLAWLALTLEASTDEENLSDYIPRMRNLSIEAVKLGQEVASEGDTKQTGTRKKGGGKPAPNPIRVILTQSVMDSIFADAYNLQNFVKPAPEWALAPMNLKEVYEGTVLPHYRIHSPFALPEAWDEFIAAEAGLQKASRSESAYLEWTTLQGRNLQWRKNLDLLTSGVDPKAAGDELIRLVSENPNHPNLGDWMNDLDLITRTIMGE